MTLLGTGERPVESLVGAKLNERWTVTELIEKKSFQTGSCFSVGYIVEHDNGTRAFAKVLDFSAALQADDTARSLRDMTDAYVFERSLLEMCGTHGLTRIVRGLDYGDLVWKDVPLGKLFFMIFEMAEGDVRRYMNSNSKSYLSWRLHVLHDIAIGLAQLHAKRIHHQDLKPSNVLVFDDGDRSKLGDLGRAHCMSLKAPHDDIRRPGAFYYAPPEQIYDHHFDDREAYRRAADLYLLGSMLDFFVTGTPTTVRLMDKLDEVHRPFVMSQDGWRGFFKDVLPHLMAAHGDLVVEFSEKLARLVGASHGASTLVSELTSLFRYATNPDPLARGHPTPRSIQHMSNYDLQPFVSSFELFSRKIAISEKAL